MERLNYSFTPPSLFPPSLSTVSSVLNPPPLALLFLSVTPIPLSSQNFFHRQRLYIGGTLVNSQVYAYRKDGRGNT